MSVLISVTLLVLNALLTDGSKILHETQFQAHEVLQAIAEVVESGVAQKRELASNCSCVLHACSNLLDEHETCTDVLGPLDICGHNCPGRKVSLNRSFVTTPPGSDPNNISPVVAEEACLYQGLASTFKHFRDNIYSWIYFGSVGGISITYPGSPSARGLPIGESDEYFGYCEQYDPRSRPWYIDATTAPKDLVILIDASNSMREVADFVTSSTKWILAKKVAAKAIELLHFADLVEVIILQDGKLNNTVRPTFIEATEDNKQKLYDRLDSITPSGTKLIEEGFDMAFATFARAQFEEIKSTRCQQVILWISDGKYCENESAHPLCYDPHEYVQGIVTSVKNKQKAVAATKAGGRVSIIATTIGNHSNTKLGRLLSCNNNGTHMRILISSIGTGWRPRLVDLDGRDLLEQMISYTSFFASQVRENERKTIWSRFYEDFSGLGLMTTCSRPLFSLNSTGSRRGRLIGVAAYDIPVSRLEENGLKYEEVLGQILQNLGHCSIYAIDQCQLQVLRQEAEECPNIHPPSHCYQNPDTGEVYYASRDLEVEHSFDESLRFCREMNGSLVEIQSAAEHSFVSSIVSIHGSWLGLNRGSDGEWKWLSGEALGKMGRYLWDAVDDLTNDEFNCAAIDSRGTRLNVIPRNCSDHLHTLCRLDSIRAVEIACEGEFHVADNGDGNPSPSLDHCLEDVDDKWAMMSNDEFIRLRERENSQPVFCPMNLEEPMSAVEATCCAECIRDEENVLEEVQESSTIVHGISCIGIIIPTWVIFIFLLV